MDLLLLPLVQVTFQGVKTVTPKLSVWFQPSVYLCKRLWT
jgi:hypothetical protein